jgi:hypothetical protein
VSEFPQEDFFQWYEIWGNFDEQIKSGIIVKPILMNKATIDYPPEHPNWFWLKRADLVFIYCTRVEMRSGWKWWELPKYARKLMRPDAKMIVQYDDEFMWVFNSQSAWWQDQYTPDNHGGPEQFFKDTGILEIADMHWTVLENPPWAQYTTKPWRYMPLPQLMRYEPQIYKAEKLYRSMGIENMHNKTLALIRHSIKIASIFAALTEVCDKVGLPVTYFPIQFLESIHYPKTKVPVTIFPFSSRSGYMDKLLKDCFIGLDVAENYVGWSRFAMECAVNYIPCVGSNYATKIFFPELFVRQNDYPHQIKLIKQLINDKEFYKRMAEEGHKKCLEHLNLDRLRGEVIRIAREELHVNETYYDMDSLERELFVTVLEKLLPFYLPPPRPSTSHATIFCDYHHRQISQKHWDSFYGRFQRFMDDEKIYRGLINEALERKNR